MLKSFLKWLLYSALFAAAILLLNSSWYYYRHSHQSKGPKQKSALPENSFDNAYKVPNSSLGTDYVKFGSVWADVWIHDKNITIDSIDKKSGLLFQVVGGPKRILFSMDSLHSPFALDRPVVFSNDVQYRDCIFFKDTTAKEPDDSARRLVFQFNTFEKSLQLRKNNFQSNISFADCRFNGNVWVDDENQFNGNNLNFADSYFGNGIDLSILEEFIDPDDPTGPETKAAAESITLLNDQIWGLTDLSQMKMISARNRQVKFFDSSIDSLDLVDMNLTKVLDLQDDNIRPVPHDQWWRERPFFAFFFAPYQDSVYYDKIAMNLAGTDVSKLNLDYSQAKLYFDADASENDVNSVFLSLLKKYQKNGETANYRLVDIDYRNYEGGLVNFLSKYWWYYGYKEWLVFVWSAVFILVFSMLNFRSVGKIYYTYSIDNIARYHKRLSKSGDKRFRTAKKYLLCVMYTGVIFFGVRVSFESIRFSRMGTVLFLLLQFIIGLICGGFIINLILH